MDFPDWLSGNSQYHVAERLGPRTLRIRRAAETPECWVGFNDIVGRAAAESSKWGYQVMPHTSSRDSGGYDTATIFFE